MTNKSTRTVAPPQVETPSQEAKRLSRVPRGSLNLPDALKASYLVVKAWHESRGRTVAGDTLHPRHFKAILEAAQRDLKRSSQPQPELEEALRTILMPFPYDERLWMEEGRFECPTFTARSNIFLAVDPVLESGSC